LTFGAKFATVEKMGETFQKRLQKNTFSGKIIMRKIDCWNGKQGFARSAEGRVGGRAVRDTER
jgi:hypothetical protein